MPRSRPPDQRRRSSSITRTLAKPSSIAGSYEKVSPVFHWFSRQFESVARSRSLELSRISDGDALLVIAPPTDYFLETLLATNSNGRNELVVFSERSARRLDGGGNCSVKVGSPDRLPQGSDEFDAVFAYCYLDFLSESEERVAAEEIKRVLRPGGRLLASYLGRPRNSVERLTAFFLTSFPLVASGVRVVEPKPMLQQVGFRNLEMFSLPQKGLPVFLAYAEKAMR